MKYEIVRHNPAQKAPMMHYLPLRLLTLCLVILTLSLSDATARDPVGVVLASVEKKPFFERIEALGTLRANESVDITANVTETITAIHFTDNQRVESHDVLAEMTSAEEQALLEEARSTLEEATRQFKRVRALTQKGNAPKSLLDQRKRDMETAQARLTATQSRLKDRLLIAPFAGVVGLRNISAGALVEPGDIVTTLDDDSQMKLDFSVPATYLGEIKVDLPIIARTNTYDGKQFQGNIASINSRIDPVTRSFIVRAILPNDERLLKPGLLMQVDIEARRRETLLIPEAALVPDGDKQFVYRIEKGSDGQLIANKVQVVIGSRRPGEVEVLEGLAEGEDIVVDGTIKLRDGMPVAPKQSAF